MGDDEKILNIPQCCEKIAHFCTDPQRCTEELTSVIDSDQDRAITDFDRIAINNQIGEDEDKQISEAEFSECAIKLAELFPNKVPELSRSLFLRNPKLPAEIKSRFSPDLELKTLGCVLWLDASVTDNPNYTYSIRIANRHFDHTFTLRPESDINGSYCLSQVFHMVIPEGNTIEWIVRDESGIIAERLFLRKTGECKTLKSDSITIYLQHPNSPAAQPIVDSGLLKEIKEIVTLFNPHLEISRQIRTIFWIPEEDAYKDFTSETFNTSGAIYLSSGHKEKGQSLSYAWFEASRKYYQDLRLRAPNTIEKFSERYTTFLETNYLARLLDTLFSQSSYGEAFLYEQPGDGESLFCNISTILKYHIDEFRERYRFLSDRQKESVDKTLRRFVTLYKMGGDDILKRHFCDKTLKFLRRFY